MYRNMHNFVLLTYANRTYFIKIDKYYKVKMYGYNS